ncbi:MAG: fluoride efflux transporter CrcB [Alphaproteobacteria bacterium]|nr:fluoride efflux transporter CrcB [Alphaproteobacteria bacterium]
MITASCIAMGGALGALFRYSLCHIVNMTCSTAFPIATLIVNLLGGLAMGLLTGYMTYKGMLPFNLKAFLITGLLGGFTTFSAFSLDFVLLMEQGKWTHAFLYAFASISLSVLALIGGMELMR